MAFNSGRPLRCALLACALACALPALAAGPLPTREQVKAAVERVRADPDMPGTKTEKKLRFKDLDDEDEERPEVEPAKLEWLTNLLKAIAEGARWLVWGLGALLVAWLVVRIRRWVQMRAGGVQAARGPMPSHVGSLDIRPQSLPDDIGAAAADLWQGGQHRPALSLLYRGALSRLVHVHAVPVRAASTEGECVALAATRLAPAPQAFFAQLVGAWQLAAYGGRLPDTAQVLDLCGAFDRQLAAPVASAPLDGPRLEPVA